MVFRIAGGDSETPKKEVGVNKLNFGFMKTLFVFLLSITMLVSCTKNSDSLTSPLMSKTPDDPINEENNLRNNCFTEEEFLSIAQGFSGFWSQFMDTSNLTIQTKLENLGNAVDNYSSPIPLSILAEIYEQELLIDSANVAAFLSTIVTYRSIISAEGFSQCFYEELAYRVGEDAFSTNGEITESRWFLSTLASALGAGPCITGPLAVLDTCAYVATGILTAPTGIGAIANWGGAVASFGYALSTIKDCP